ncbi:HNH endonuclease signature motif containing protein [Microbacterium elymi]|uniref:HNH endonuclease n=1 Tax=Microbacterium elymi TaxID=2909587 RepID=A0ABY5NIE8_9MICO|nr:HNH endonuclease signature motif containing protein [Microbacterium elymi]UUT34899.1 HNH endonuclease [Microbacterium elymi]
MGHDAAHADADAAAPVLDERTQTQIMADVFCDLLLTSVPDGHGATDQARTALGVITPTVQVTIPATTLAGTTIGGAAVAGFGPIDDDTAKQLAGAAPAWIRVFTDPCSGVPISVDRYRPRAQQKLFLQVRDQQCRFPGCRRPAKKCDIDHAIAYAEGGPTCLCNLEHLCERHHTVKHETDWFVEQLGGGILRWTAPTLRTHITRPPGTVRFELTALLDPDPKHRHAIRQGLERDPAPF